jgi:hypothetical protein
MDKESLMKKNIGLWIDHRKAVIVIRTGGREELKKTTEHGKHVRFTGGNGLEDSSSEGCARPAIWKPTSTSIMIYFQNCRDP